MRTGEGGGSSSQHRRQRHLPGPAGQTAGPGRSQTRTVQGDLPDDTHRHPSLGALHTTPDTSSPTGPPPRLALAPERSMSQLDPASSSPASSPLRPPSATRHRVLPTPWLGSIVTTSRQLPGPHNTTMNSHAANVPGPVWGRVGDQEGQGPCPDGAHGLRGTL